MMSIKRLIHSPTWPGILLMAATIAALVIANSPLAPVYDQLLTMPVAVQIGTFHIDKVLLLWVNDGLMAVFFLMVGLELKRELLVGDLNSREKVALPALAAFGGMAVPALFYIAFNVDSGHIKGWAIPSATDIAFALAILSLFGERVPKTLKVFLVSLAIFDDFGAIIIIALFYSNSLSLTAMLVAATGIFVLFLFNRFKVYHASAYLFVGLIIWAAVLKSGVHATLAGVVIAALIPMKIGRITPAKTLENDLHGLVNYLILPIFAFSNAGIYLLDANGGDLIHPVTLGIFTGLVFGKPIGIMLMCFVGVKLGIARLPNNVNYTQLTGAALLCGIGFTMSLFIGSLAFQEEVIAIDGLIFDERLGILAGSIVAGVSGYWLLAKSLRV